VKQQEASHASTLAEPGSRALPWPTTPVWIAFFKYAALVQILWLLVYGGADWIASLHDYRVKLHYDLELAIPFHPAAAVVYWSVLPLMWLSPFVLGSVTELRKFMVALAVVICVCGIGFLSLPSVPAYRPADVTGPFAPIFYLADRVNLTHNMCPSLHVAMAALAASAYSQKLGRLAAMVICLWTAAIALSTLFCHQHHLIDVVTGAAIGYLIPHRILGRI
jgi:membrane-associated phospholipid phosphatase